ncbi:MAG: hypothetical protein IK107_04555, partial [Oscillospiraceae bacterium]|nr:hypothetical protein [Oscillospiraceae bacterium]
NYCFLRFFVSPRHMLPFSAFASNFCMESQGFFLVALFNFQGAVAVPLQADSLFIIAHFNRFVKPFSKLF